VVGRACSSEWRGGGGGGVGGGGVYARVSCNQQKENAAQRRARYIEGQRTDVLQKSERERWRERADVEGERADVLQHLRARDIEGGRERESEQTYCSTFCHFLENLLVRLG